MDVQQRISLELALIVLLVMANGVFSMSEIALVSSRRSRLQRMAPEKKGAATALRLAENPERFLSTIQIGITLIGVFTGAFGGATIASEIDDALEHVPGLAPYSEVIGVGLVVIGITYLTLILGELVPKRLALNAPERIASVLSPIMERLARLAAPAVWILSFSTRAVLWALRARPSAEPPVTEEELRAMLRVGAKAGTIGREEREIAERAFMLNDRPAQALMTPRMEMEWLDTTRPLEELRRKVLGSSHQYFPVAPTRIDAFAGIVRGQDLWSEEVRGPADLLRRARQPLFVHENASALTILQQFRDTRVHVAAVLDEFGGVEGILTATDLLEALVGELPELTDRDEPMIVQRADGSWSVDAAADLEEVKLIIGADELEGQKKTYQTVGGYLTSRGAAQVGDTLQAGAFEFEIVDMDRRRIDRVLISRRAG